FGFNERWGRWSQSTEAGLRMCFEPELRESVDILLEGQVYLNEFSHSQRVRISVNDREVISRTYRFRNAQDKDIQTWRVPVEVEDLDSGGCAELFLSLPDAVAAPSHWRG